MSQHSELILDLDDQPLKVQIRRSITTRSLRTGRELAELNGVVTTGTEQTHQWLSRTLPGLDERILSATDPEGERVSKWVVSWNAYSVNAGVHSYSIILREAEELTLESLLIDGTEHYPYEYRERVVGDGLALWAKLVGTVEDVIRMRQLVRNHRVISVVRRGIHDEPRQMRFAVAEWSHFEDRIKYRLVLVDDRMSHELATELVMMEEENSRAAISFYANFVDRLTENLIEKGILSDSEVAEMRTAAGAEPTVSRPDIWRVPDVDAL